jgi:DNA-binding response OmpR family regulator
MRILVVEDDRKVASFLEKGPREEGYAVDVAHDGVDGRKLRARGESLIHTVRGVGYLLQRDYEGGD